MYSTYAEDPNDPWYIPDDSAVWPLVDLEEQQLEEDAIVEEVMACCTDDIVTRDDALKAWSAARRDEYLRGEG